MKKMLSLALLVCAFVAVAQTAKAEESWGYGLYSDYVVPADYTIPGAKKSSKVGCTTCQNIVSVKLGDCSITSAMKNGNITSVSYAEWEKSSILGIVNKKTLKVYGN